MPQSPMMKFLSEYHHYELAHCYLTIRNYGDKTAFASLKPELSELSELKYVYISSLDVHASDQFYMKYMRSVKKILTAEETIIFKGLGKKLLCSAIRVLVEIFKFDLDSTVIYLQAQGNVCHPQDLTKYYNKTYGLIPFDFPLNGLVPMFNTMRGVYEHCSGVMSAVGDLEK